MSLESDTRDRVIALEVQVKNLEVDVSEMKTKIDEMHAVLMQAKGARYVIALAAAIAGGMAGFLVKFLPWTASLPK